MSTKYGVNSFSLVGSYRCDIWDICHGGDWGRGRGFWNMGVHLMFSYLHADMLEGQNRSISFQ